MAIRVPRIPCVHCGKRISDEERVVAFPAFTANKKDPLYLFNDAIFHQECFETHPLAERALLRSQETQERLSPGNRYCIVCEELITDPDDYLTPGHLTDDELSPLFKYNFVQVHRSHLEAWSDWPEFRKLVLEFQASDAWDGPAIL